MLHTSIEFLKGVGSFKAELLRKELNIASYSDLLHHFPYRYIDSTQVQHIKSLQPDQEWVQLRGIIMNLQEHGAGFKKRLTATLYDQTGQLELVWFQGISFVAKNIQSNTAYSVFGKLSFFNGFPTITHPELELVKPGAQTTTPTMLPAYSVTEKLRAKGVNNRSFAKLTQALLEKINPSDIYETLPPELLQQYNLCGRYEALSQIHFPQNARSLEQASHRLKWEELFIAQLKITKANLRNHQQPGYVFGAVGNYFNDFYSNHLPFELTNAQKRVIKEIRMDTLQGKQMNRLVQGDVGSGKTMVALLSMLIAIDNGYQSCMMAPTEILAQQHFQGISELLKDMPVKVAILTGSVKTKERRKILEDLKEGRIAIIIGTHALVEDTVVFYNLGLAVIDEQHRFGVSQRAKLWQKNTLAPHVLVMTATPIPRTLAMTLYGDLDVSVIDELPPGRKPIHTIHRFDSNRFKVMEFIKYEIGKGRQIYIVYPLIDESDKLEYESLLKNYEQVKTHFPDPKYNVAMVHGKQAADEKERNMQRFVSGEAHILVSTTVIEVGVNVPNASVMLIESAERFGLSQLHQLRGRVGRGSEKSYCILLTSTEISKESRQRMSIMTQTNDGFLIAEEDLKMRGPGDIYGTRQSGALDFKIADIIQDVALVEETKNAAAAMLHADPELSHPNHRMLYNALHTKKSSDAPHWNKIS
ncbi:ATP-dependent DNA helicase RecG [Taibaiella sp. KBW10]|nr:ATP-dependent DNA helicase RecG [Taibaiella sp. KBW10]RQO29980.1 ATP-dependent DNA helicase RecG [Taibaiella sp. KBW10]